MEMLPGNQPAMRIGLTVVRLGHNRGIVVRLWSLMKDGQKVTLLQWECPSGRPSEAQLEDITASLAAEASVQLVASFGVQQVIEP